VEISRNFLLNNKFLLYLNNIEGIYLKNIKGEIKVDQKILIGILETYNSIISLATKLPGIKFEDAFNEQALKDIKNEYQYLLTLKEK
jgi:hypothetical protein